MTCPSVGVRLPRLSLGAACVSPGSTRPAGRVTAARSASGSSFFPFLRSGTRRVGSCRCGARDDAPAAWRGGDDDRRGSGGDPAEAVRPADVGGRARPGAALPRPGLLVVPAPPGHRWPRRARRRPLRRLRLGGPGGAAGPGVGGVRCVAVARRSVLVAVVRWAAARPVPSGFRLPAGVARGNDPVRPGRDVRPSPRPARAAARAFRSGPRCADHPHGSRADPGRLPTGRSEPRVRLRPAARPGLLRAARRSADP